MISMTLEQAEQFVEKSGRKAPGSVRWDGWNMIFHDPDDRAVRNSKGRYHNGRWGYETEVSPNGEGMYLVRYSLMAVVKKLARGRNARR